MPWNSNLTTVRNRLATLFPDQNDARRVVEEAGLETAYISFDSKSINNWHSILNQAELRDKVQAIVVAALQQHRGDSILINAFDAYMAGLGRAANLPPFLLEREPDPEPATPTDRPQTKVIRPMKILFLAANPRDMDRLKLDEEVREIDQVLRRADYRDQFELVTHWAVRNNELLELLQRHKPDIVHFSGHGTADDQIMLVNESGTSQPISGRLLARIFSVLKGNIRCVVLNACYSPTQAEAIAEHIEVVIGMSNQIADQASYEFSGAFYQGLAYGQTVQTAFDLGAIRIEMADPNTQAEPVLFAKHADASKIIFVHATPAPTADQMDTSTARREINADSPLTALKRQRLKTQLEDLKRQLEAVFQELRANNNPVARDRLEIQRSQLEEDMAKAEADLEALV